MRLRKGGRRREGLVGIHNEHNERMEVGGTATGHLHRRTGALARLGLPGLHSLHPLGATNALLSSRHKKSLRAGMAVHGCHAARRTAGVIDSQQIFLRVDTRNRADFSELLAVRR